MQRAKLLIPIISVTAAIHLHAMSLLEPYFVNGKIDAERIISTLQQQPLSPARQWNSEQLLLNSQSTWTSSLLPIHVAEFLVKEGATLLRTEPNVLDLKAPIFIFGDLHGHFCDLLELLRKAEGLDTYGFFENGHKLKNVYLFMGDYVDRGSYGTEILLFLLTLKIAQPGHVFLLRGNHETRSQTMRPMKPVDDNGVKIPQHLVGIHFKREIETKYGSELYREVMKCFDALPLAAVLSYKDRRFLCIHGGLSPSFVTLDDLNRVNRFREPELKGIFCDILWSDPVPLDAEGKDLGLDEDEKLDAVEYIENDERGAGHYFGIIPTRRFLEHNKLNGMFRAHQMEDGVFANFKDPQAEFPLVTTVFSAANYCGVDGNSGGTIEINETGLHVHLLEAFPSSESEKNQSLVHNKQRRYSTANFGNHELDYVSAPTKSVGSIVCEKHASWVALRKFGKFGQGSSFSFSDDVLGSLHLASKSPSLENIFQDLQKESIPQYDENDLEQLRVIFEVIDINGDSTLEVSELRSFMTSLYSHFDEESTVLLFTHLDANQDGRVSFTEFVDFFKQLKLKPKPKKPVSA